MRILIEETEIMISPSGETYVDSWPPKQENITLWVRFDMIFDGEVGSIVFDTAVVSGACVKEFESREFTLFDTRYFTYPTYDPVKAKKDIEAKIQNCEAETYDEIITNLRKIMIWEYERDPQYDDIIEPN